MVWELYETAHSDLQEFAEDSAGLKGKIQQYRHFNDVAQKIAILWENKQPSSDEERDKFYAETDLYLFELSLLHTQRSSRKTIMTQTVNILNFLQLSVDTHITDFGGGIGTEALSLLNIGYKNIILVDLNKHLLDFAKYRAEKYNLPLMTMRNFQGCNPDVIITYFCLEHIFNIEEIIKMFFESGMTFLIEKSSFGVHIDKENPNLTWPQHSEYTAGQFQDLMNKYDWFKLEKPNPYYPNVWVNSSWYLENINKLQYKTIKEYLHRGD